MLEGLPPSHSSVSVVSFVFTYAGSWSYAFLFSAEVYAMAGADCDEDEEVTIGIYFTNSCSDRLGTMLLSPKGWWSPPASKEEEEDWLAIVLKFIELACFYIFYFYPMLIHTLIVHTHTSTYLLSITLRHCNQTVVE